MPAPPSASAHIQKKRAQRQGDILKKALNIAATEGIRALTVHRLAEALDCTAGALYRYYPSMEALFVEMQRHAQGEILAALKAKRAAWQTRPGKTAALARLLAMADFYLTLPKTMPEHARLIAFIMGDPRQLVSDENALTALPSFFALLEQLDMLFSEAITAKAISKGPVRDKTLCFWGALTGIVQLGKLTRYRKTDFDPARLGPETTRALLLGWGADKALLTEAATRLKKHPGGPL